MRIPARTIGALALLTAVSFSSAATINISANAADARIEDDSGADTTRDGLGGNIDDLGSTASRVGSFSTDRNIALVYPFALPSINPLDITAASVSFFLQSFATAPTFDAVLTALDRKSSSPTLLITDFEGTGTDLATAFLTPTSTTNQQHTFSGAALVSFLQNAYTTNTAGDFVFFRLKPTNNANNYADSQAYVVALSENTTAGQAPVLSIDVVPEPASLGMLAMAGTMLFRRRRM